jgi:hypothetical protein
MAFRVWYGKPLAVKRVDPKQFDYGIALDEVQPFISMMIMNRTIFG